MSEKFRNKSFSPSQKAWIRRQESDHFSHLAKNQNFRSRSAYKLIQILEKDKLIKPNQLIVDLGAAPGGWSQVAAKIVGGDSRSFGQVFALDLLPITGISQCQIIQGDFLSDVIIKELEDNIITYISQNNQKKSKVRLTKIDGLLSDMSPNISGIRDRDNELAYELWLNALDFCQRLLKSAEVNLAGQKTNGGFFICKLFQSPQADEFTKKCKKAFKKVIIRKPAASRSESRECFLVAQNFQSFEDN